MPAKKIFRGGEPCSRREGARASGRRQFMKGLLCAAGAAALGRCGSAGNSPQDFCQRTETPFKDEDFHLLAESDNREFQLRLSDSFNTSPAFGGYRVRLDSISESAGSSGCEWDRDVMVAILDESGAVVEGNVALNPFMMSYWESPGGLTIVSYFAAYYGAGDFGNWAGIGMYDQNSPVRHDWVDRKLLIEQEQPPDCLETETEEKLVGHDSIFTPGLISARDYEYAPCPMLGNNRYILKALPPAESAGGWGELTIFDSREIANNLLGGSEHEFTKYKLFVEEVGWNQDNLYAKIRLLDLESGELLMEPDYPFPSRTRLMLGDDALYLWVVPSGGRVALFPEIQYGVKLIKDGARIGLDGANWRASMDYSPEGESITGLTLDLEE